MGNDSLRHVDVQEKNSPDTRALQFAAENSHTNLYVHQFPLTEGHVVIEPKRDVSSIFAATANEIVAAFDMAGKYAAHMDKTMRPDGWNMLCDDGIAAGQTAPKFQIHMIPRYRSENSRLGIRNRGGFLHMNSVPVYYQYFKIQPVEELDVLHEEGPVQILAPVIGATHNHFLAAHEDLGLKKPFENPHAVAELFEVVCDFKNNMIPIADGYHLGFNISPSAGQFHPRRMLDIVPCYQGKKDPKAGALGFYPTTSDYYDMEKRDKVVAPATPITLPFRMF